MFGLSKKPKYKYAMLLSGIPNIIPGHIKVIFDNENQKLTFSNYAPKNPSTADLEYSKIQQATLEYVQGPKDKEQILKITYLSSTEEKKEIVLGVSNLDKASLPTIQLWISGKIRTSQNLPNNMSL